MRKNAGLLTSTEQAYRYSRIAHGHLENLSPGERFPDIEFPKHDGAATKLSGLMDGFHSDQRRKP
jgi:hypothetical protein